MSGTIRFAWWNVGNLFPPGQHPDWREWDEALFGAKLANLGQAIQAMDPDLLGLAEVADEGVLSQLVDRHLSDLGYRIVHHEGPDLRGIDVAFLYGDAVLQLEPAYTRAHTINKRTPTRDILEVYFTVPANGAKLAVLGNHWPSRSGGVYRTEPFRIMVAEQCGAIVDQMLAQSAGGLPVLVLGDLNDEPFSRSVQEYLVAIRDRAEVLDPRNRRNYLYNCMWRLMEAREPGTYYYAEEGTPWYMFDQVIVSPALLRPEGSLQLVEDSVAVFRPDWMRRRNGSPKPFAKLEGRIVEGYSDHFPVFGQLAVSS